MREGGVNDISSAYAVYIRMSQMYIAEMFGSVDSNGTEHVRCENAIALLSTRSLLLNVFAAPCISYALVQATVGVGTVLIWDLILIWYQT